PTVVSDIYTDTRFIYDASVTSPTIQVGMNPSTILPEHVAVLRGTVLSNTAPLGGVRVTVKGRPEFGQTWTRDDGAYDLVVNGGGTLEIEFHHEGYLPVQRSIPVPLRDYVFLPDVVLT